MFSYPISRYFYGEIPANFDLKTWEALHPDFYVPPHQLLYILLGPLWLVGSFLINSLVPGRHIKAFHIVYLYLAYIFKAWIHPIYTIDSNITMFQIVYKFTKNIFDLGYMVHFLNSIPITLSFESLFGWALNFLNFGLLASSSVLRPDKFDPNTYCLFNNYC